MTGFDIARLRLFNQRISAPSFRNPDQAVGWLVAAQAQDYMGAKWALGLRMQAATDADIDRAFNSGAILRTHLMRPTWHFITPADIGWMLALTGPRVQAGNASMYRQVGLERDTLKRGNDALAAALAGGSQLTREELAGVLQKAGIEPENGLRLSLMVMCAELDGVICSGPRRGKQFTYALLDERAPNAKTLKREEALAELAGRYFISRGPASVQDLAKWSGLTVADTRLGLEAVKSRLENEKLDNQVYWFPPSPPSEGEIPPAAYLLSVYDEYISSYKDHSATGPLEVEARLKALGNDLRYIIVIDGQVRGTWKRTFSKDGVVIDADPFTPLTAAESELAAEAARRFGEFLDLPVVLRGLS